MKIKAFGTANHKSLIGVFSFSLFLSGCATTPVEDPTTPTGTVTSVTQSIVAEDDSEELTILAQRQEEIAERSVADRGANTLIQAQRVATVGVPFSSYHVGGGDRIVASLYNQEGDQGSDIWVLGQGRTRITQTSYFNDGPSFSNDGRFLYFSSRRGTRANSRFDQSSYIWRMASTGGSGLTRIGTPVFEYLDVYNSPDGSNLLFTAREFYDNSYFIWYSEANGTLPTQLTQGVHPKWMGNDRVVFSRQDENSGLFSIWTIRLDGTELTQIVSDIELDCITPSPSPNGRQIAYVKETPGDRSESSRDVYVYSLDSGLSQQITTNISRDDLPQWSGNGDTLYFRSTRGVAWNIWQINAESLEL